MVPPLAAAEVALAPVAAQLLQVREELLLNPETHLPEVHPVPRDWGPTELYNRYDDSSFQAPGIEPLRKSHRDLLDAVLRQYGWTDLADEMAAPPNLGWGFERPWIDRTERYVPVLRFREQMLERLMALNEQRYWEEIDLYVPHVVAVLPERKPAKVTKDACKEKGIVIDEDDLANVLLRAEKAGLIKRERDGAWTRVQGAKAKTGARVA
jgi:hypothetical protein